MKSRPVRFVALAVVLAAIALPSAATAARSDTALGRSLVQRFFGDLQHHKVADLRKFLSPAFQIQRADGSHENKFQYLHDLPIIKSFKLRKMIVTSTRDEIVCTYEVASDQIINGKQFKAGYAPRLSVFTKTAHGWQIVGHANFNTPK